MPTDFLERFKNGNYNLAKAQVAGRAILTVESYNATGIGKIYLVTGIEMFSEREVSDIIGINTNEYIFHIVKYYNAQYYRGMDSYYFETEEEAKAALDWCESIRMMSVLEKAGR